MILDDFIAAFKTRFPDRPIALSKDGTVATIPGASPNVGNIDGLKPQPDSVHWRHYHGHFDCHGKSLSEQNKHEVITSAVLDFLANVFEDKVEFFRNEYGGGWRPAGSGPELSFTWSSADPRRK